MDQAPDTSLLGIDGLDDVAGARLVDGVKLGERLGFDATGAMDHMRHARHHRLETGWISNRTGADFDVRQVGLDELPVARRPEQQYGW
jgi:hypothetical protein